MSNVELKQGFCAYCGQAISGGLATDQEEADAKATCQCDCAGARAEVKEVVFCESCKNFTPTNGAQYFCDEFGGYVDDDDFCSRGEKCEGKGEEQKNENL